MNFFIDTGATEEQLAKLTKLLTLWESKANFFDACVISKLRNSGSSLQEYQASLLTQFAPVITQFTAQSKATYDKWVKNINAITNFFKNIPVSLLPPPGRGLKNRQKWISVKIKIFWIFLKFFWLFLRL